MSVQTDTLKPQERLAREYVDTLLLKAIADSGPSAKLSEILEMLETPELNAVNVRVLLSTNPERFVYADRRWSTAARHIDSETSVNEALRLILKIAGVTLTVDQLANQCELIYGRPSIYYQDILLRFANNSPHLFVTNDEEVGLAEWIFQGLDETVENALFYNNLTHSEIDPFEKAAAGLDWHLHDTPTQFLKKAKKSVSLKIMGFFAWRSLNPNDPYSPMYYSPVNLYDNILKSGEYTVTLNGIIHPVTEISGLLKSALQLADKLAPTVPVEEAAPLEVNLTDLEQLVSVVLSSDEVSAGPKLLEQVYEVSSEAKTFEEDRATLVEALKKDGRIVWMGADRFRKPDTLPPYVMSIPELLEFPPLIQTGEEIDIELVDEGFPSSLRKEVLLPLAQDVLDEELLTASTPGLKEKEARCVLKAQHHEIGTFPLVQIHKGFLPLEPELSELTFIDKEGKSLEVFVNNETRLMYGLFEWYLDKEVESGAVFTLARTPDPSVYQFAWLDENDSLLYISPNRMEELRNMQATSTDKTVFEILTDVMEKHPKGADYLTIMSEVNVIRRTKRKLIASLLSGYHCFSQRSGSPLWHYDAKKVDQGFDKAKKKFVKKALIDEPIIEEEHVSDKA